MPRPARGDGEAHWVKHKGRPAVHGFKAHVGADADTALVEELAVTPANVNDGRAGPDALRPIPARCLPTVLIEEAISRRPCVRRAGRLVSSPPACGAVTKPKHRHAFMPWNRPIHRIRGRIEKIFGTWKRSYGLRRMRWRGLAKAAVQIHFTAIAYNMKRTLTIAAKA
ncbi:MAG: transposase [Methylovirgula sp.]